MKNKNHKFKYVGKIHDKKVYLVVCKKTGGDFSSILFDEGKTNRNTCPCCCEEIK